jgi:phosphoglucosamine mutase
MTNKSLEIFFEKKDIPFLRADVGDKYVLQRLLEESWVLGGEPSGHIICLDSAPTGDAIIAALNLLNAIKDNNFSVKRSLEGLKSFLKL